MLHSQVFGQKFHHSPELFLALVQIDLITVRIVYLLNAHIGYALAIVITHTKTQLDHIWRRAQGPRKVQ